jgi:hypothetical protein
MKKWGMKETVEAYFKVVSWHSPERPGEKDGKSILR